MSIKFNVKGYTDRRGPAQIQAAAAIEQERLDQALLMEYNRRVQENVWGRKAMAFALRLQAE